MESLQRTPRRAKHYTIHTGQVTRDSIAMLLILSAGLGNQGKAKHTHKYVVVYAYNGGRCMEILGAIRGLTILTTTSCVCEKSVVIKKSEFITYGNTVTQHKGSARHAHSIQKEKFTPNMFIVCLSTSD